MTDQEFRALLNLMMCSDPWPASKKDREKLEAFCNVESLRRGFDDWIMAYHEMGK